jgi:hypothetical protein
VNFRNIAIFRGNQWGATPCLSGPMLAALLTLAIFGGYLFNNFQAILDTNIKGTDYSLIALQSFRARSFEVLLGPYSRFSFNHPGPIQFYFYSLAESLPVSYSAAHAICQLVINALSYFLLVWYSIRIWGSAVGVGVGCVVGMMVYLNLGFLSDTWGPSAIYIPYLLYLVAGIGVGKIRGALVICALAACWVVSNHLGLLLPIVLSGAFVIYQARRENVSIWEWICATLIFAVCFALPFYELYANYPLNNFQRFLRFLGRYSPTSSLADLCSALFKVFPGAMAVVAAGLVSGCLMLFKKQLKGCAVFLSLATLGHLLSLSRTVGALHPYLFWPILSVLSLTTVIYAGTYVERQARFVRLALVFCCLVAAGVFGQTFQHDVGKTPELYNLIMREVDAHPDDSFKLMTKNHQNWEVMTAVADNLARHGRIFCVQDRLQFIFGRDLVCSPSANYTTLWFGEIPKSS